MISLSLQRWSAWLPGVETPAAWSAWVEAPRLAAEPAAPSAAEVPALLRRRCDALSRALLHVAGACCEPPLRAQVATVFATRFGPLGAIVENLEALAAGRPPSPMTFSHAVHNTALGLFSIWAKNRAPGSALAAGEETFAHGWLEATLVAQRDRGRPVLLVCGDEAIPRALAGLAPAGHGPYALALLLRAEGEGERIRFGLAPGVSPGSAPQAPPPRQPALPQALAFLRWWIAGESVLALEGAGRRWQWERV